MSLMNKMDHIGLYITIVCIILAMLLIVLIANTITKPIKLSYRRLEQLSEGDLTSVVQGVRGKDESARLIDNLNKTTIILKDIIQEINHSVSENNEKTSYLLSEISEVTSEQAEAIKEISTALHQITEITQENSATASDSAQTSLNMKQQAEQLMQLLSSYKY